MAANAGAAGIVAAAVGAVDDAGAEILFAAFGGSVPRPPTKEFVRRTNTWSVASSQAAAWIRTEASSLEDVASMLRPLAQGIAEPSSAVVAAVHAFVQPLLPQNHRDILMERVEAAASGRLKNSDGALYSKLCTGAAQALKRLANRLLAAVWPDSVVAERVAAEKDKNRRSMAAKRAAERAVAGAAGSSESGTAADAERQPSAASSAGGSLLRGGECVTACESATTQFAVLRRHSSSCARVESRCRAECLSGGRRQRRQR